jgi:hypothetical protein
MSNIQRHIIESAPAASKTLLEQSVKDLVCCQIYMQPWRDHRNY